MSKTTKKHEKKTSKSLGSFGSNIPSFLENGKLIGENLTTPEEAIRESNERFRIMMEQSPLSIQIFDKNGATLEVNRAWEIMWDSTHEEVRDYNILKDKELKANGTMKYILRAFAGEAVRLPEVFYDPKKIGKKGRPRWLEGYIHPLSTQNGILKEVALIHFDITERKNTEYANALLGAIVKNSDDAIISKDLNGIITSWNESAEEIFGFTAKEAIGKSIQLIIPQNRIKEEERILQQIRNGLPINHFETVRQHKDGTHLDISLTVSPIRNRQGKIVGASKIARNITERKRHEKAIRKSERDYHELIKSSPSMIVTFDGPNHTIGVVNDAVLKTWGKEKDIIGKPLAQILPELHEQGITKLLDKVYETGEVIKSYETPLYFSSDGNKHTRFFNLVLYPRHNSDGKITSVVKIATDVTTEAKLNQKIKESETRYRQMADLMPAKIINLTPQGEANYFNRQFLEYTGLDTEQLVGMSWTDYIHPDDLSRMWRNWKKAAHQQTNFVVEFRMKDANGVFRWHLARAVPIIENSKKMWICAATDIQSLKDEEKRKEDFLKMVSHELKTPVTSIKGYIQLLLNLLKKNIEGRVAIFPFESSLRRMDHQVNRLTRLISEILDISRIDTAKFELLKKPFNIGELVDETIQDIKYTNTGHHIYIHHIFDCQVYGDMDRIGQVLINLVNNAVKYSPSNKEINVYVEKDGNDYVKVKVKDEGIGIAKKDLNKVFNRFYRVEGEKQDTFAGFGIGLFLCKEIIERHGGTIEVESEKGKGSVFSFKLKIYSA